MYKGVFLNWNNVQNSNRYNLSSFGFFFLSLHRRVNCVAPFWLLSLCWVVMKRSTIPNCFLLKQSIDWIISLNKPNFRTVCSIKNFLMTTDSCCCLKNISFMKLWRWNIFNINFFLLKRFGIMELWSWNVYAARNLLFDFRLLVESCLPVW